MITKIDNDVTLCKMGDGTLFTGVFRDQHETPRGIAISKTPHDLTGGVAFQIDSMEGFAGYMNPALALMEEWHKAGMLSGTAEENDMFLVALQELRDTLAPFLPKAKDA